METKETFVNCIEENVTSLCSHKLIENSYYIFPLYALEFLISSAHELVEKQATLFDKARKISNDLHKHERGVEIKKLDQLQ